jgi:hypothetical protein
MTLAALSGAKGFLFYLGEIYAEEGVVVVVFILISESLSMLSLTVVVLDLKSLNGLLLLALTVDFLRPTGRAHFY